jgi:acyl dehydratase
MIAIDDLLALGERAGREIAASDWMEVTQDRITQFAEATGDRQWIHVDPARAAAESPFGSTIAHGFLTLSLISVLMRRAIQFPHVRMAVNYGVNRVRFPSPVRAGARVRGRFAPASVERIEKDGSIQVTWTATIDVEGADKPACVAEWVVRYYH